MSSDSESSFEESLTPEIDDEQNMAEAGQSSSAPPEDQAQSSMSNSEQSDKFQSLQASATPTMVMSAPGIVPQEPGSTAPPKLSESVSAPASNPPKPVFDASTTSSRPGAGIERFRASARKIIHMRRGSTAISGIYGVGAEPGIDPRKSNAFMQYGHIRAHCKIEVINYSSVRSTFDTFDNKGYLEYLSDPKKSTRAKWAKVRWINVAGISWDVISALALEHDIHPLALEDVIHGRLKSRSKSDYFSKHLFIRILRHTLMPEDARGPHLETVAPVITSLQRSESPSPMDDDAEQDDEKTLGGSKFNTRRGKNDLEGGIRIDMTETPPRGRTMSVIRNQKKRKDLANSITIEDLKRGERVNVATLPFFIFLFRDGTVVSLSPQNDEEFTTPIVARLRQRDTGLRATADPSLLVQSLLDLVVDKTLEVVDEYQHKILKLEQKVLIRPNMKTVRYLHILSGDLTMHKRTLEPIKTLVYGLRRYDRDRCAALVDGADISKVQGYMSQRAIIYLADVYDHIDHVLNSMDMFANISENLINYTFNMASYEMNDTMKRLTYVTVICLPLTLLSGYFGMNFTAFWSVHNQSDLFYWEIAIPMVIIIVFIFMYSDLGRMVHLIEKRWNARKVGKAVKQKQL
ncbi:hypothetical protein SCHPADRAFT_934777 [Schizopora paradoxa]|uniref:Cora-domain-containing protein n=1 Tax=Schizopora paradoxa TaxID=27342 RepID=A0A0H2S8B7_9AGAM|nr:hypothetical protein SCHPADRAFT_934777 [Schizopora paradoxa]